jgi:hypothetical protein
MCGGDVFGMHGRVEALSGRRAVAGSESGFVGRRMGTTFPVLFGRVLPLRSFWGVRDEAAPAAGCLLFADAERIGTPILESNPPSAQPPPAPLRENRDSHSEISQICARINTFPANKPSMLSGIGICSRLHLSLLTRRLCPGRHRRRPGPPPRPTDQSTTGPPKMVQGLFPDGEKLQHLSCIVVKHITRKIAKKTTRDPFMR